MPISTELFTSMYYRLQLYIDNTGWIMAGRLLSLGLKFAVVVAVSRYLGPEQYGLLAYALSLTALFSILGHMGFGGLVVRELVDSPERAGEALGTVFVLKCIGALIGYLALLVYALLFEDYSSISFWLITITGLMMLLAPFHVIDLWFEAHVRARFVAISSLVGLAVASLVKFLLIFTGAGLLSIAASEVLGSVIVVGLLCVFFKYNSPFSRVELTFNGMRAKELLYNGWPIYLGSIFAVIYLKVDQIMLRWIVGAEEVGLYAVASQISEVWYFVPVAIVSSVFPALIETRKNDEDRFKERFQQLLDFLFIMALAIAVTMSFFAEPLIRFCFGEQYAESATILVIHIWAALFIFMRAAFSRWILIENVVIFSLITQGMGAVINIIMNYPMIHLYGAQGAAVATLVSYAVASFFSLYFFKRTRLVFWQMVKAMASPVRYTRRILAS